MGSPDTVPGFLDRIDRSDQCWSWPGVWQANGYPLVKLQGRQWLVHRLAYNLLNGPLEQGQQLDKTCGRAGCVRPGPGHWELRPPRGDRLSASSREASATRAPTSTAWTSGACRCIWAAARVNLSEADSFGNHCVVVVSSFGWLIQTAVGSAGGWGGLRTKRSGCWA
jgi:hypothetical protein